MEIIAFKIMLIQEECGTPRFWFEPDQFGEGFVHTGASLTSSSSSDTAPLHPISSILPLSSQPACDIPRKRPNFEQLT